MKMTNKFDFTRRNRRTKVVENVGHMEIRNAEDGTELYIYGDIVSNEWDAWTPEDTFPQKIADFLSQIDSFAPLTVYINSGGGDVFAGIAIHSILMRHKGHKKGIVDALAASIASVILMACDEIVVNSGAQIMIHKPLTIGWWGNADDFQKLIDELNKCQRSITDIYMGRVKDGVTEEKITELINAETWMNGAEAQEIFDLTVEQRPAMAACVSGFMGGYKHKPADIKTAEITEFEDKEREAAKILEDLYLYGT